MDALTVYHLLIIESYKILIDNSVMFFITNKRKMYE